MTIKLTNKQLELYRSKSKLIIGDGIVGAGKSTVGLFKLCNDTQRDYSGHEVAIAFKSVKQYKSIGEAALREWCRETGATIRNTDSGHYITTIHDGVEHTNKYTRVLGRDVSSASDVQGLNLCGAFVDEAPNQPQEFLHQLSLRLRVPGHRTIMVCNPEGGKRHWFYQDYIQKCKDDPNFGTHLVFTMDDDVNPSLEPDYYPRLIQQHGTTSHFARRNLFGEWVDATGLIWNITGKVRNPPKSPPPYLEITSDVATSSISHSLLIGKWPQGNWVIDEWRHDGSVQRLDQGDQVIAIIDRFSHYGTINKWVHDPAAAEFNVQLNNARNLGYMHPKCLIIEGNNDRKFGIRNVSFYFAQGRLFISPNCGHLLTEIDSYVWDKLSAEKGEDVAPKRRDHGCDALRYWVMENEDSNEPRHPVRIDP